MSTKDARKKAEDYFTDSELDAIMSYVNVDMRDEKQDKVLGIMRFLEERGYLTSAQLWSVKALIKGLNP